MEELLRFFTEHGIDDFSVINISSLSNAELDLIREMLPSVKSIIVFGKEMPLTLFKFDVKLKSYNLSQLEKYMDVVSFKLCDHLMNKGHHTVAVPTFLPIRVTQGRMKGIMSLKHAAVKAGMGSLGTNTLLISERFGNRLCLSAVLTEVEIHSQERGITQLCQHCTRCINACPTRAISEEGVDSIRCINFTNPVPSMLRPIVKGMVKTGVGNLYLESYINSMGYVEMVCSRCLTECPYFNMNSDSIKDKDTPGGSH